MSQFNVEQASEEGGPLHARLEGIMGSTCHGRCSNGESSEVIDLRSLHLLMDRKAWYTDALDYWDDQKNCSADVEGVLGGFGSISEVDVEGSRNFLRGLVEKRRLKTGKALDLGGGVGRVSTNVLARIFDRVVMLEVSPRLCDAASKSMNTSAGGSMDTDMDTDKEGQQGSSSVASRVEVVCGGMETYRSLEGFDCIWCQWCVGHFSDKDFVTFLKSANEKMNRGAYIILKDNCTGADEGFVFDEDDSSVTRSREHVDAIFCLGGWQKVEMKMQEGFPENIFPVPMVCFMRKEEESRVAEPHRAFEQE